MFVKEVPNARMRFSQHRLDIISIIEQKPYLLVDLYRMESERSKEVWKMLSVAVECCVAREGTFHTVEEKNTPLKPFTSGPRIKHFKFPR